MRAIDKLIEAVKEAVHEYDQSGDHRHVGATDGAQTDCIRCNLVAAIGYSPIVPEQDRIRCRKCRKVHLFTDEACP